MTFMKKLCRFTFIIYEGKHVFLSNLIFLLTMKANHNFSNIRLKMNNKLNYRRYFFVIILLVLLNIKFQLLRYLENLEKTEIENFVLESVSPEFHSSYTHTHTHRSMCYKWNPTHS